MNRKGKLIIALITTIAIGSFISNIAYTTDFQELFKFTYGYIDFKDYPSIISSIIKWIIPQLVMIFFWGDYLEENLLNQLKYILTRTGKVDKYIVSTYLKLLSIVLITCAFLYTSTFIVTVVQGNNLNIDTYIIKSMAVYFMYMFLIIVMVNTLSIFVQAAYAVFIVLGTETVFLIITKLIFDGLISEKLYRLLPTSTILFYSNNNLMEWGAIYELLYLSLLITVAIFLNILFLKNKEVL